VSKRLEAVYVPLGEEFFALRSQLADPQAWASIDDLTPELVSGKRVVLIGRDGPCESEALKLIASGLETWRVEWATPPEATLDAVRAAVRETKDVFWKDYARLTSVPIVEGGFPVYKSGIGFLDKNLNWGWRLPELGIVAGPYTSGKSLWLQQLAFSFVVTNGDLLDTGALICGWEDDPSWMHLSLNGFAGGYERHHGLDPDWRHRVDYVRRPADADRLVKWYIDLVAHHHAKFGTRFFTLDPWNEMDHVKDIRQIETEYIREMMKEFRRLVDKLQIILIIATHVPAKMIRGDGSIEPFRIAHSFGSSQFANKADRGMCVVRSKKFEKEVGHLIMHLDKSKVEKRMGTKGTIAARWNERDGWFDYDANVTAEVQDIWKD
jgi:archaellum biogenesis ATPase FlaH